MEPSVSLVLPTPHKVPSTTLDRESLIQSPDELNAGHHKELFYPIGGIPVKQANCTNVNALLARCHLSILVDTVAYS